MRKFHPLVAGLVPAILLMASAAAPQTAATRPDAGFFEAKIRPVLLRECVSCHGQSQQKGGLRLDIEPKSADIKRIRAVLIPGNAIQMPPSGPLNQSIQTDITKWLESGALWPKGNATKTSKPDTKKHWAFLLPIRPSVPKVGKSPSRNPIDAFINQRLATTKTTASGKADRRTLIRRASYDLTGLPPTPVEVDVFLADKRPGAWERVIDRLLASPRYGEKWGRLWLDIVHYADTAGENSDHPLPHIWKYRNWVINAFNRNIPYTTFIQHQLAGDLLAQNLNEDAARDARIATGFLAGARRFGHDIDADMHLTYEDVIDTTSKATLGLTLACARCHDHKFDPIPQRDYYALYGIFKSTKLSYPGCEPFQQPKLLVPLTSAAGEAVRESELQALTSQLANLSPRLRPANVVAIGKGSVPDSRTSMISDPGAKPLQARLQAGDVLLFEVHPNGNHGADTTRLSLDVHRTGKMHWQLSDVLDVLPGDVPWIGQWMFLDLSAGLSALNQRLMSIDGKSVLRGWRSGDTPSVFGNIGKEAIDVWTSLPGRSIYVHPGPKGAVGITWTAAESGDYTISGSITDAHPGGDGVSWTLSNLPGGQRVLTEVKETSDQARTLEARIAQLREQRNLDIAFACTEGTGADANVQIKGDPAVPGALVARGAPSFLGLASRKVVSGSGRLELAQWITDRQNPLTARVWVNRIWQGHFGTGIVATSNDFGLRGAPPMDQKLLDWLAVTFMETGWDTKRLHRMVMCSDAYQRKSGSGDRTVALAAFPRRRLTAEELRDTYLMFAGILDIVPGVSHPFPPESSWAFTQHTPFADDYETNKRSVYVMQKRNRRTPFFALFDGPDPNASTAVRDNTTVPTQALWLMNSPFVQSIGDALAEQTKTGTWDIGQWMNALYRKLFGRLPSAAERSDFYSLEYQLDDGKSGGTSRTWEAYVKALVVSNEVLYVD